MADPTAARASVIDEIYGDLDDDGNDGDDETGGGADVASMVTDGAGRPARGASEVHLAVRLAASEARVAELEKLLTKAAKKNGRLASQVAILEKNISSLYKTAHMEVTRKDRIIGELRVEVERLRGQPST